MASRPTGAPLRHPTLVTPSRSPRRPVRPARIASALLVCSSVALAEPQTSTCTPSWGDFVSLEPGPNGDVLAVAYFDAGSGPELHIGGRFTHVEGTAARGLARQGTSGWRDVGGSLDGDVHSLCVYDDGTGAALYAGGTFTTVGGTPAAHVAKWDGTSWSSLGAGVDGVVEALFVFDQGSGPELHVGGAFTTAGGTAAANVAKWNGSAWSTLGTGADGAVHDFAAFDPGSGRRLVAGGDFTQAGGTSAAHLASWDGAAWSSVGTGVAGGPGTTVRALETYDDGQGPDLYVGGNFTTAGGLPIERLARWDGTSFSRLVGTTGATTLGEPGDTVFDLQVYTYPAFGAQPAVGPALVVAGDFQQLSSAQGLPPTAARGVATWTGSDWTKVGHMDVVYCLGVSGLPSTPNPLLLAGGRFKRTFAGYAAENLAVYFNNHWGATSGSGYSVTLRALQPFDAGNGQELFVGGSFYQLDDYPANGIARWTGAGWDDLAGGLLADPVTGLVGLAHVMQTFDDGGGPALFVGGRFNLAGGVPARNIAKWDGNAWRALGAGIDGYVLSLAEYDDGSGPALYAGGLFTSAGGISALGLARWDGTSWSAVGPPLGPGPLSSFSGVVVYSLAVFDSGNGDELIVGGQFDFAGSLPTACIARWNGTSWNALGSGLNDGVFCLTTYDDGAGEQLYAGGWFHGSATMGPFTPMRGVARWNGSNWSPIGGSPNMTPVNALQVFDENTGEGPRLFMGYGVQYFWQTTPVGPSAPGATYVARLDGSTWTNLQGGPSAPCVALASFDDGGPNGPVLLASQGVGPAFQDYRLITSWNGCLEANGPKEFCFGDGGTTAGCTPCPCNNDAAPGTQGGCLNSAGRSARLSGGGLPDVDADTLYFEVRDANPSTFGVLVSAQNPLPQTGVCAPGSGLAAFDGLRCIGGAALNHGSRVTDSSGDIGVSTSGWGAPSGTAGGLIATSGFLAGQTRHFQCFYRESPASGCFTGQNTTNAASVTFL